MKKLKRRLTFATIGLAALVLIGCASEQNVTPSQEDSPHAGYIEPQYVDAAQLKFAPGTSVAVLPFSVSDSSFKASAFESTFFAGELVKEMRSSNLETNILFAPQVTPAVDYVIQGSASCSLEDVFLRITISDFSGREIASVTCKNDDLTLGAGQALKAISTDTPDPQTVLNKRLRAYAGQDTGTPADNAAAIANLAASIERQQLLAKYTDAVLQYADQYREAFQSYREALNEIAEARREQENEQKEARANETLGFLSALASAAGNNQAGVQNAQQQMIAQQSTINESKQRVMALDSASAKLSRAFGSEVQPTPVLFLNRSYNLSGSYDEQVGQFRQVVKQSLIQAPPARSP